MIDYWDFCMAIAEAVCPTRAQHYRGIECIVGKMVKSFLADNEKWSLPAEFQTMSFSKGQRTLDQPSPNQHGAGDATAHELPSASNLQPQGGEVSLPYQLTEADRRALSERLPDLPPLQYPISDADKSAFLDAWFRLKNRPTWEPILVTAAYIDRRKNEQPAVLAQHQTALQDEFASGKLDALNAYHAPVRALMAGSFIPRQQAIAYLERRGIAHSDQEAGNVPRGPRAATPENRPEPAGGKRSPVDKQKLTDKDREELVAFHAALKRAGVKNPTQQTMDEYGVSDSYVRELIRQAKAKKMAASSPFPRGTGK
ncbi:AlpA family phage regulatory protein [Ralstonia solanacearum]|nr:AlpA family phage regulatory protein [Ralstonia solanacearum]